jgi:hypothetical protein
MDWRRSELKLSLNWQRLSIFPLPVPSNCNSKQPQRHKYGQNLHSEPKWVNFLLKQKYLVLFVGFQKCPEPYNIQNVKALSKITQHWKKK